MISLEETVADIRLIIAGKEDFVYNPDGRRECLYLDEETGNPSCLIGHWMVKRGFRGYIQETEAASSVVPSGLVAMDAVGFLTDLQERQDTGHSWGEALELALDSQF